MKQVVEDAELLYNTFKSGRSFTIWEVCELLGGVTSRTAHKVIQYARLNLVNKMNSWICCNEDVFWISNVPEELAKDIRRNLQYLGTRANTWAICYNTAIRLCEPGSAEENLVQKEMAIAMVSSQLTADKLIKELELNG